MLASWISLRRSMLLDVAMIRLILGSGIWGLKRGYDLTSMFGFMLTKASLALLILGKTRFTRR